MKILSTIIILIGLMLNIIKQSPNQVDLNVVDDYYEGLQISKEINKPIFLFFSGLYCENPKMVNDLIKKDIDIINRLNKSFVPVILNVSDRTELPKKRKVLQNGKEITIRTKGNEWQLIEISKFNDNSQPFIIMIDSNEEVLKSPIRGKLTKKQILKYLIL